MANHRVKKKRSPLVFIIPIVLVAIAIIGIVFFRQNNKEDISSYDENSLIGTFLYEENNTRYIFKEDGTGSMSSGDYNFEYNYKIDENILNIDFAKDEVHDVKYSYELNDGTLKLISKEGTVSIGEEYILKKENK